MPTDDGVDFESERIGHLLEDRKFAVQEHQRSYKWDGEDHVRRLFDDVAEVIGQSGP